MGSDDIRLHASTQTGLCGSAHSGSDIAGGVRGGTKYVRRDALPDLLGKKLISKRPHPTLPLDIYNYTAGAQFMPIAEWSEALKDCRGLILDRDGYIVGRPFRKFWNYEQVLGTIPVGERFNVWEKLDGSLGIVCYYAGERVVATRGSFESDQARWFSYWLGRKAPDFYPDGVTYLFEIVYPENRIVVDYGATEEAFLLSCLAEDATDLWGVFDGCDRFRKARRFDGIADFAAVDGDPRFAGQEGFVIQWESGFRAKVKLTEYKRLHRLITQCSTRTIWELLRSRSGTAELMDRVPADFAAWAQSQIDSISGAQTAIMQWAYSTMATAPAATSRKEFALWAKTQRYPGLLFLLLDGRDISDTAWKLVEPKWATPFRKEME